MMRKILFGIAFSVAFVSAFAALDTTAIKIIPLVMDTAAKNATNSTVVAVGAPMKGTSEIVIKTDAHDDRTDVHFDLYATNSLAGGWTKMKTLALTDPTDSEVLRFAFPGEHLTDFVKIEAVSLGEATQFDAFAITNK